MSYSITTNIDTLELIGEELKINTYSIPKKDIKNITISSEEGKVLYRWTSPEITEGIRPYEVTPQGVITFNPINSRDLPINILGYITTSDCSVPLTFKDFIDKTIEILPILTFMDIALDNSKMLGLTPYKIEVISEYKIQINERMLDISKIRGIKTSSYQGDLAIWSKDKDSIIWTLTSDSSTIEPFLLRLSKYKEGYLVNIYY